MRTQNSWFHSLVLASLLATGFAIAWGMLTAMMLSGSYESHEVAKSLIFLPDGTPVIQSRAVSRDRVRQLHWNDLAGNSIPLSQIQIRPVGLPFRPREPVLRHDIPWNERIRSFAAPLLYWYFVADARPNGSAYFVAYDSQSRERAGFLGTSGFRTDNLSPEDYFPYSGGASIGSWGASRVVGSQWTGTEIPSESRVQFEPGFIPFWLVFILTDDHKIYRVDLARQTVNLLLDNPHIHSATLVIKPSENWNLGFYRLAVRLDDTVLLLDESGEKKQSFLIPEPLRDQDLVWTETTKGEALVTPARYYDLFTAGQPFALYWVDPSGRVRQAEVPSSVPKEEPWYVAAVYGLMVPAPLILDVFVGVVQPLMEQVDEGYRHSLNEMVAKFRPALILAHAIGAVFAVLCYRRQVRYAIKGPGRHLWPLFVFLLGLPGWIGYLYGRWWPRLEPCPSCGALAPRNRETCARCVSEFPRPVLKGTEVFA